jgi:hypothetical protein
MSAEEQLRLLWFKDIQQALGKRTATTQNFFTFQNITSDQIVDIGVLEIYVGNPKKSREYLAHEADRFSSAAFETLTCDMLDLENTKSIAWPLIRSYYAAFFALHALIRIHGWSCTNITSEIAERISRDARTLYPISLQLSSGLYLFKFESGGRRAKGVRMDGLSGSSHEKLWSLLVEYLSDLTRVSLQAVDEDYASSRFSNAIELLSTRVKKFGGVKWFTKTRNKLNYSHEFGAWFPYTDAPNHHEIHQNSAKWLGDPADCLTAINSEELFEFSEACLFIVSMCRTTILDLSKRSKSSSTFKLSSYLLIENATRKLVPNQKQTKPKARL